MRTSKIMSFEELMSRSFGKGRSGPLQWRASPRGLIFEDVERYLDSGDDINRRTDSGQTLLHIATDNGQLDVMRLLLARGANINAKGYHGYTPLHLAVDMDCDTSTRSAKRATELPITALLIQHGADESVRDDDGKTAREIAMAYGAAEAALYDSLSRQRS